MRFPHLRHHPGCDQGIMPLTRIYKDMEARLMAISGPLEGAVFPLDVELSIGREKTNTIPIEDRVLSRRHCLIQKDNGHFNIRDLTSSNGTYVNGLPIAAHVLKDGDQIGAGQSLFLFVHNEVESVVDRKSTRLNSSHLGISYAV